MAIDACVKELKSVEVTKLSNICIYLLSDVWNHGKICRLRLTI